jgi:hypothetical protein
MEGGLGMGLSVLTIQDEADGQIRVDLSIEPQLSVEEESLTDAQILGLMALHAVRTGLAEESVKTE